LNTFADVNIALLLSGHSNMGNAQGIATWGNAQGIATGAML